MLQPLAHVGTYPIIPWIGVGLLNCLPMIFTLVALPVLDWILGEEDAQELGAPSSPWMYNIIFYVFAALHLTSLLSTVYVASLPGTSVLHLLLLCLNQGMVGGYAINAAHELTHHNSKADQFLGEALLTSCCYKHWHISHRAHHAHVRLHLLRCHRTCAATFLSHKPSLTTVHHPSAAQHRLMR